MVSKIKRSKKLFVLLSCLDCNGQGPAGRQSLVSEWPRLAGAAAHSPWAHGWDLGHLPEPGPGKVGSGEGAVGTRSGAGREESWVPPSQLRISAGWGPVDGRESGASLLPAPCRGSMGQVMVSEHLRGAGSFQGQRQVKGSPRWCEHPCFIREQTSVHRAHTHIPLHANTYTLTNICTYAHTRSHQADVHHHHKPPESIPQRLPPKHLSHGQVERRLGSSSNLLDASPRQATITHDSSYLWGIDQQE